MLVCPGCKESKAIRRARRQGSFDGVYRLLMLYPYRCDSCLTRFRRFGAQTLAESDKITLPTDSTDPTAFTPLRYEARKAPEGMGFRPRTIGRDPASGRQDAQQPSIGTPAARPQPVFLSRQSQAAEGTVNPLSMERVTFDPSEMPIRHADHEHFDPMVLAEDVAAGEAPMRADGEHIFDPLAMENAVLDRAVEVNAKRSRFGPLLSRYQTAQAARAAFLGTEEGRALRHAEKKQRRWMLWTGAGLSGISAVATIGLYSALGSHALNPKVLWLTSSAATLPAGMVLSLFLPGYVDKHAKGLNPRFVELALVWTTLPFLLHFALAVVLIPFVSHFTVNFGFYAYSWPWLWIYYATMPVAAGFGGLTHRLLGKKPAAAE